jgi:RNA polymerase sigma factor (TIGR02999 family)
MPSSTTQLLIDWGQGSQAALDELIPRVYAELHSLARTYLSRERPNHTLQPTALINELFVRLIDQSQPVPWQNRTQFFGIAARLMRQILVNHARERKALKRGGGMVLATLEEFSGSSPGRAPDILEIDEALNRLAEVDGRKARVIELCFFGGLTREEIAHAANLSLATVKRDLRIGEAWLMRHLRGAA